MNNMVFHREKQWRFASFNTNCLVALSALISLSLALLPKAAACCVVPPEILTVNCQKISASTSGLHAHTKDYDFGDFHRRNLRHLTQLSVRLKNNYRRVQ